MRWILSIIAVVVLLLSLLGAIVWWSSHTDVPARPATAGTPATTRSSATTKTESPPGPRVQAYSDLLRLLPGMAEVSFSESKLALEQLAKIHLPYWAYICPRRDLWISHPDAPDLASTIADAPRGVHLSREQVVFVHWTSVGRQFRPTPVFRDDAGRFRVHRRGQAPMQLQRFDYHWDSAVSTPDAFVVPTDLGISVVRVGNEIVEDYQNLLEQQDAIPCVELTPTGFIAWVPTHRALGVRPKWYSNGSWRELPAEDWAGDFLHLIPFADGSVLQVRADGLGKVKLQIVSLESIAPDLSKMRGLVAALSDDDIDARDDAHAQLVALGPAAWSALEQFKASADPELQLRVTEILRSRTRPVLGRLELIDNMLRPVWRLRDGAVFLAESGVSVLSGSAEPEVVTPAWISVRRGRRIELLPSTLARSLSVGTVDLYAAGPEWVVSDGDAGAQLFFGRELLPLTSEKDRGYRKLAGIDRQGRVLLARTDARPYATGFLLLDPTVADPTPTLQVWTMSVEGGDVGWSSDDWPAVRRGQAYALKREGWEALKGELVTSMPGPASRPSPRGAMTQLPGSIGGATVWIGGGELQLSDPSGHTLTQTLPAEVPVETIAGICAGTRVYLLHPGGKLTRLRVQAGLPQPFSSETVFNEDFPNIHTAARMWLDPAGRLCIATDDGRLAVLFTERKVPTSLLDMIPADELKQARPSEAK